MSETRLTNLLGALGLATADLLASEGERTVGRAASAPACLLTIATRPGISIEALRAILGLSQPATVRLVDNLVADGLVTRNPGPDNRTRALALTPEGTSRATQALTARHTALETLLEDLDAADRESLTDLLERVLARLPQGRSHARHLCRLCDHQSCETPYCPIDRAVPD
ncbi:MarR family transcriptional regulator [Actinomadura barringtoniae]|uniref:MarR family transcriptional regulator n=1 Tax=Actinomadura barringtoniae TaxID=1427535 RepID=A0A939T835_9ACTN|nr:MarR family transcriptional regulator [Actinomadura barringtoniae]MBO2452709.1 MarR family transcriptional regulator [Actinomadura barringtoniae]